MGDTELNLGRGLCKAKCKICEKTVGLNQKHFTCEHCFEIIHCKCLNYLNINQSGTCPNCLFAELQFYKTNFLNSSVELLQQQPEQQIQQPELLHDFDPYLEMFDQNRKITLTFLVITWSMQTMIINKELVLEFILKKHLPAQNVKT